MSPELAKRLAPVFPGLANRDTGVTVVAGVAGVSRDVRQPERLRQLRPQRLECDDGEKPSGEGVAADVTSPVAANVDAIEERTAFAADCVPACYLDAWALLQCQQPLSIDLNAWRQAIDDAGCFLDARGAEASKLRWAAGDLFDVPREGQLGGLIWRLHGARVAQLEAAFAVLSDGRKLQRPMNEE
jgi:hypothetical protein